MESKLDFFIELQYFGVSPKSPSSETTAVMRLKTYPTEGMLPQP
jgi:hypothetical protein